MQHCRDVTRPPRQPGSNPIAAEVLAALSKSLARVFRHIGTVRRGGSAREPAPLCPRSGRASRAAPRPLLSRGSGRGSSRRSRTNFRAEPSDRRMVRWTTRSVRVKSRLAQLVPAGRSNSASQPSSRAKGVEVSRDVLEGLCFRIRCSGAASLAPAKSSRGDADALGRSHPGAGASTLSTALCPRRKHAERPYERGLEAPHHPRDSD